jgi:hypothetical protein
LLDEFNPIIQEHVCHITNDETHVHYLDFKIQNELLYLLPFSIRSKIIKKIKCAKYLVVILDCTPDTSHQENFSLIIRHVELSSSHLCIEESYRSGQGIFMC